MLQPDDGGVTHIWELSLARSRHVKNHNALPARGVRSQGPDWVGQDRLYYGDSDLDNHDDSGADDDLFIIQYLPLYLAESA